MKIRNRSYLHVEVSEEGTLLVFNQSRDQWEQNICCKNKVGKILSSAGDRAVFFTAEMSINMRIASGVVGAWAKRQFGDWEIPF